MIAKSFFKSGFAQVEINFFLMISIVWYYSSSVNNVTGHFSNGQVSSFKQLHILCSVLILGFKVGLSPSKRSCFICFKERPLK